MLEGTLYFIIILTFHRQFKYQKQVGAMNWRLDPETVGFQGAGLGFMSTQGGGTNAGTMMGTNLLGTNLGGMIGTFRFYIVTFEDNILMQIEIKIAFLLTRSITLLKIFRS